MYTISGVSALFLSALLVIPSVGRAQTTSEIITHFEEKAADNPEISQYLRGLAQGTRNGRTESLLRSLVRDLIEVSPSGELTQVDIERKRQIDTASARGNQIGRLLAYDLNGDGAIDHDERALHSARASVDVELLFIQGDTDADGTVSFPEILAYVATQSTQSARRPNYTNMMLFDIDNDGIVRTSDLTLALDALEESGENLSSQQRRSPAQQAARCTAPKPPEGSEIIVLSAYEGAALSTVSVVGMDNVTHVGKIIVEEGDAPFYLFLVSHANMIWEITGDTDRIATVVVQEGIRGGGGVVGVPRDNVHFVERQSCMSRISSVEGGEGIIAYRQIARNLEHDPDHMLAHYSIGSISLPSGQGVHEDGEGTDIIIYDGKRYELGPNGPRAIDEAEGQLPGNSPYGAQQAYRSMLRFSPGGIRSFDVKDVIASGEAEAYDVMPQQAGLLQLLLEGQATYTRDGFYLITAPIARYPAGLAGAHSVKFMIAEGTPMPEGSPGHSAVYLAETGECISGAVCR